jgi:hypothetical protein
MAARIQGSVTAYAISLALFVILFVFSFILAIVFKTQIKGAQVQAQAATRELTVVIKPNESNRPEVLALKAKHADTGASIVGQLLDERRLLKAFINAAPNSTIAAIEKEIAVADVERGQALLNEITRLRAEKLALERMVEQNQTDMQSYIQRATEIEAQKSDQTTEYERTMDGLRSSLATMQDDVKAYRTEVDTQRQTLEGRFGTVRSQTQQSVNELRSTLEQKDRQIVAQRKRLEELIGELAGSGKGGGPDLTRESDGEVTSILSEEGLVYIDLGRADHILLGMTFEVFDKDTGVSLDEANELRGKATVEIIRMTERSSLARVVRLTRGQTVNEGDLIANIIYDPNISYRFHVFGAFDIDSTGQATTTDRRRVETMVTQWGGQLVRELSYNSDFLVLGQEPQLPERLPASEFDPVKIERVAAQKRKYETYQGLISEAKALSIPILNQNRFLVLVGYYQR